MAEKRFKEPRSRKPKDCVHWGGLGQRLNRQKNHLFRESEMDGFSHLYIQMHCLRLLYQFGIIVASNACVATNPAATKVASNAYGTPYAKNAHFRSGGSARFLLVGKSPKPFESQVPCKLRT